MLFVVVCVVLVCVRRKEERRERKREKEREERQQLHAVYCKYMNQKKTSQKFFLFKFTCI